MPSLAPMTTVEYSELAQQIKQKAKQLGFADCAITDIDLSQAEARLQEWLAKNFHGEMDYMSRHGSKRTRPHELVPGTVRVICVRMDYLTPQANVSEQLSDPNQATIACYAHGRDYHKLIRKRLQKLINFIESHLPDSSQRAFTDSAPVMEKALAEKAGLGWIGKSTNLINKQHGSWFFLGTIYTDCPLPVDKPAQPHCGSCSACMDVCPTGAIVGPFQLDARRCVSYLTIEHKGSIPVEFRRAMGNRVYGCDDCQVVCPFNKFAQFSQEDDFTPRHRLNTSDLLTLWRWSEQDFIDKTRGSAIARIGYERWLRNLAVGLGNAPASDTVVAALQERLDYPSELVREHVTWALSNLKSVG